MIDFLFQIDQSIFIIINNYLSNSFFDMLMPLFHHTKTFLPLLIFPWILTLIYDKKNRWKLAILIPIGVILVDQTGVLIKETISRPRPFVSLDPNIINHLVSPRGPNMSFPSNHAANTALLATIFSSTYSRFSAIFWSLSIIVMFSRIYIGVHYPADVLCGFILGYSYGLIILTTWNSRFKTS